MHVLQTTHTHTHTHRPVKDARMHTNACAHTHTHTHTHGIYEVMTESGLQCLLIRRLLWFRLSAREERRPHTCVCGWVCVCV